VEPLFSTLTMINREGDVIDLPKPAADPSDTKVLVIKLPTPLPPGIYYVEWHALAVDTHRSQGHFRFTVTP
jgi:methionine-rich copper-binding protein CopC